MPGHTTSDEFAYVLECLQPGGEEGRGSSSSNEDRGENATDTRPTPSGIKTSGSRQPLVDRTNLLFIDGTEDVEDLDAAPKIKKLPSLEHDEELCWEMLVLVNDTSAYLPLKLLGKHNTIENTWQPILDRFYAGVARGYTKPTSDTACRNFQQKCLLAIQNLAGRAGEKEQQDGVTPTPCEGFAKKLWDERIVRQQRNEKRLEAKAAKKKERLETNVSNEENLGLTPPKPFASSAATSRPVPSIAVTPSKRHDKLTTGTPRSKDRFAEIEAAEKRANRIVGELANLLPTKDQLVELKRQRDEDRSESKQQKRRKVLMDELSFATQMIKQAKEAGQDASVFEKRYKELTDQHLSTD